MYFHFCYILSCLVLCRLVLSSLGSSCLVSSRLVLSESLVFRLSLSLGLYLSLESLALSL